MANLFQLTAPCPLFAVPDGMMTQQSLVFQRSTHDQTSAGEVVLSFANVGTFSVDLQPMPAGIVRVLHGVVYEVAYRMFLYNNPDIRDGDRCTVSSQQLEIITTARYGVEHVEADLRFIGR